MIMSITWVELTTEISEHIEHRALSTISDKVETDYYRFSVGDRKICIADRHVTSEKRVNKSGQAALDDETLQTSSSHEECVSVMVDRKPLLNVDVDMVDDFTSKLRGLNRLDLMNVLVPSWLLAEIASICINERIEARVKAFYGSGFIFVQNAKIVHTRGRYGPPEESEMDVSVGNHFLDLAFVPDRYVRLSTGAKSPKETVSWSPEWERFIQACMNSETTRGVCGSLPDSANSFLFRSSYLESQ